ncbi:MAG: hypothetical protein EXS51_00925 [Candidatus Taylorbacteria bacterium]|nr:hypothetical protein [Candidatus Taylorbacteria bacterium]
MKFILFLALFSVPIITQADGGGWLPIFAGIAVAGLLALLLQILILFPFRNSGSSRFFVALVVALMYALATNFWIADYDIRKMFWFAVFALLITTVVAGLFLAARKRLGADTSSLKALLGAVVTAGVLTILFSVSYSYASKFVLAVTDCRVNVSLGESRDSEQRICVIDKAKKKMDPVACSQMLDTSEVKRCEYLVGEEMLGAGNLVGCKYIKGEDNNILSDFGPIRGQQLINMCANPKI